MSDERLLQAFASWQNLSLSQEELNAYEGRLRRIQDEEAARSEAAQDIEEAQKQVEEEHQKRIEAEQKADQFKQVAIQSMLAQNLRLEEIAQKLELSLLEVQEIIEKSK